MIEAPKQSQSRSAILHTLTRGIAGHFIRRQGQTQGITVTDAGTLMLLWEVRGV